MKRIEHFFYTNNEPYISSYSTDMLSSVVKTIGAEYPFVPDVLPKFKNQIYFAAINSRDKSTDCNSLFDEAAKSLEFSLHSINLEEYNAWSLYWESSWDIFFGFCLDILSFLPSFQGIIEGLMSIFVVFIGAYALTAETVNELYNKVKGAFEEYQKALLRDGTPTAYHATVLSHEWHTLTTERYRLIRQGINLTLDIQNAQSELSRQRSQRSIIQYQLQSGVIRDEQVLAKLRLQLNMIEEKIFKLQKTIDEGEIIYKSLMKRLQEIVKILEELERRAGDTFRNSSRMSQLYQSIKSELGGIWFTIKQVITNPPDAQPPMPPMDTTRGRIQLLRMALKKLLETIYYAFYTFFGGLARAVSKTATVVGKYIPYFIFAYIVYFFYDLFGRYASACSELTDSAKGFTVRRQKEVDDYYDMLEDLISAGCCDKPSCPIIDPAKPPECMKADGTCDNDGSGSDSLGSMGVRLLGIKTIQKFKHCGYKPDCIPKPDCTKWNNQYPGGVDNQPNYSTSTWPSQPYGAGGVAAIDTRGVFSPPVVMPKPRPASFPTGPGQSNRACGWAEEELPDCVTWETIETAIVNAGNAMLVNIGNGITDVLDGISQTLPGGDDFLESAFP